MKTSIEELAAQIVDLQEQIKSLKRDGLKHAALDGISLPVKDDQGGLRDRFGKQPDGSYGNVVVRSPTPPQATAPLLTAEGQAGACEVGWDGDTFDGRKVHAVHGHTEVWAEYFGEISEIAQVAPGPDGRRVGTIRDRAGGEVQVALPKPGYWAVWLRILGADRGSHGAWSPVGVVEISPLVDTSEIEAELDQAQQDIQQADDRLTSGQEALSGELGDLDTRVGPALEKSISAAVSETQSSLQTFQTEWDANWDPEAISNLQDRADATDAEVAAAQDEAAQAKQDAATAQAEADALEKRADATDSEVAAAKADAAQAQQDADAAQAKADAVEAQANGIENTLADKAEASELNQLDDILRGDTDLSDHTANKFWANMAVVSRLQAVEGWIGGVALEDNTVTAKHVDMVDFTADAGFIDNAFVNLIQGKKADFEDMMVDRIVAESSTVARQVVSAQNLIPDPLFEDFDWWTGLQSSRVATSNAHGRSFRISQSEIDASNGYVGLYTPRYEAKPGTRYTVTFKANRHQAVNPGNDDYRVWIRFTGEPSGYVANTALQQNFAADGWNDYEFTFEVPDNPDIAFWELGWTANALDGGHLWVSKPRVENALDGRMVIDGLVEATEAQLDKLFFDTAVGDSLWVNAVQSRLVETQGIITEDMIATRAITTPKLTVTDEMVGEIAKFIRIETDSLASNEIKGMLITGTRIEGVEIEGGTIESGSFQTSTDAGHKIAIDQGDVSYHDTILQGLKSVSNAPHVSIRTNGTSENDASYILIDDDDNSLVIAGGNGGANGLPRSVRIPTQVYGGSGSFEHRVTSGSIGGNGQSSLTPLSGLFLANSSLSQQSGIAVMGPRSFLQGRLRDSISSSETFGQYEWGAFNIPNGSGYVSGSATFGNPVPNGNRYPNLSASGTGSSWSDYEWFTATGYHFKASGFSYNVARGRGSATTYATFYLEVIAPWN